jgi:hypothetical protein
MGKSTSPLPAPGTEKKYLLEWAGRVGARRTEVHGGRAHRCGCSVAGQTLRIELPPLVDGHKSTPADVQATILPEALREARAHARATTFCSPVADDPRASEQSHAQAEAANPTRFSSSGV